MTTFKTLFGTLMLVLAFSMPGAVHAESATSSTDIATKLKALYAQIESLQQQLKALQGEVRETLQEGLKEGMMNDDVKKIQELLATDPEVYPRGLITGYFGPMTKEAIKRFQWKAGIAVTGDVSSTTRALFEEMLTARFGGNIPPGLLHAPGIYKKFLDRMHDGKCDSSGPGSGSGPFCKQGNDGKDGASGDDGNNGDDGASGDDGEDGDSGDDGDSGNTATSSSSIVKDIDVTIGSTTAQAVVKYKDGHRKTFTYTKTDENDIIDELANDLNMDASDVKDLVDFKD